jgi:hypothetical protein
MANLIIKSTANDLVIQGSDASPAITVGTTGTTTFAEATTLSGATTCSTTLGVTGNTTLSGTANNLGTVTTMTLPVPSSTANYPNGHVLQVTTGETSGGTIHSSITGWVTIHSHSITPLSPTSDIMIWFSGGCGPTGTPAVPMGARVIRGSTEVGVSYAKAGTTLKANTASSETTEFSPSDRSNAFSGHFMDKTRSSGTSAITYNLQVSPRQDSGTASFRVGSIYGTGTTGFVINTLQVITTMEIEAS